MKVFIGPRLRRLRKDKKQTQGEMGRALGISTSYVNLLEKNERSVSVTVLLKLLEVYGVDWRDIAEDEDTAMLADLRAVLQDPLFDTETPDLTQLRAAMAHCPDLAAALLRAHRAYLAATDQLLAAAEARDSTSLDRPAMSPEAAVHTFFRRHKNHFPNLERSAEAFWEEATIEPDDVYSALKSRLSTRHDIAVKLAPVEAMSGALREYDESARRVTLSQALDHTNRVFQLVHVCALIEQKATLDTLLDDARVDNPRSRSRCRVELANYFAAAVLMPYQRFLDHATRTQYDFASLAAAFGVSFEQACHRATTLQRPGALGVPFFFLRVDKAGNVTKRFNATDFHLAEYGGACPRLDIHTSFRTPGRINTQFVEMHDSSRFFVFSRTVDRPMVTRHEQDLRLAVAMGCAVEHIGRIGYAEGLAMTKSRVTPIGINCRVCPRQNCEQRAHDALVLTDPLDTRRRGATRYDH